MLWKPERSRPLMAGLDSDSRFYPGKRNRRRRMQRKSPWEERLPEIPQRNQAGMSLQEVSSISAKAWSRLRREERRRLAGSR